MGKVIIQDFYERRKIIRNGSWQHLHFFQHLSFLHCDVPRITTSDGSTNTVEVPWARPESGFNLMFEAMAMALIEREMPITKVAEILGVYPQRIQKLMKCKAERGFKRRRTYLVRRALNSHDNVAVRNFRKRPYAVN